jgi:MFS transporter, SHS family, lactate transporter
MVPYFIHNLVPRRQARETNRTPLVQVLRSLTWLQWAQFFTGYNTVLS